MSEINRHDYYYGKEASQFNFLMVPDLLFSDINYNKNLSSDAKLLYSFMLRRMGISRKNGWIDERNRVYVRYSIKEIQEDFNCGKEKAIKLLRELEDIVPGGLIERNKKGQGKADLIYVKNFIPTQENQALTGNHDPEPVGESYPKKMNYESTNIFQGYENPTSRSRKIRPLEVGKTDPNYIDLNKTDTDNIYPIHPSQNFRSEKQTQEKMMDGMDRMDEIRQYTALINKNLVYPEAKADPGNDADIYEDLYNIVKDVVLVKRSSIKVGGIEYPYDVVRSVFLKLNLEHIKYAILCMQKTSTEVKDMKNYLITVLYNSYITMNTHFDQMVRHDGTAG